MRRSYVALLLLLALLATVIVAAAALVRLKETLKPSQAAACTPWLAAMTLQPRRGLVPVGSPALAGTTGVLRIARSTTF